MLQTDTPVRTGEVRAVCLDIDDTLADSGNSARSALSAIVGNDDAWPVWQRTSEEHYSRFTSGELDFDTMRRERTRAFFADLGEYLDDCEIADREERRMSAMRRAWRLFDDAAPCLEWLRAVGLKVAAITNTPGDHQRHKLTALGLGDAFDHLVISGELGAAKPDPVIFHTACVNLGVLPSQAVHVGDRLDLDAVGARDAGMHGVWLNRSGVHADGLPVGISMISSLAELPELLVCEFTPAEG